ncbi:MAG: SHOCT domain-containing protein [Anaerolineaceae bacterium]
MKRTRLILFISLGIGLIGLVIPLILMLNDPSGSPLENATFEDWLPFIIVPFVLIIITVSLVPFLRLLFPPVIKNGITAEAEVLEVRDTGVTINDNPQVGLLLEVRPSMAATFQTELKTVVSRLQVGQIIPGIKAEVLYDPSDPKRMVLKTIDLSSVLVGNSEARLEELNRLRDKGLITAEEYQRKREEIIKAL